MFTATLIIIAKIRSNPSSYQQMAVKKDVVCVYIYIYMCVCIYICVCVCVCVYTYIFICVYIHIYMCVYICVYIYNRGTIYNIISFYGWILLSHKKRMKSCHLQKHEWTYKILFVSISLILFLYWMADVH